MIFGHDPWGTRHFNGSIDDVGIWSRALTQQEITGLYISNHIGIDESTRKSRCNIYPNPSNGIFTVSISGLKEDAALKIYSLSGQLIYAGQLINFSHSNRQIDIKSCPKGVYFIRLITNNQTIINKIMIE